MAERNFWYDVRVHVTGGAILALFLYLGSKLTLDWLPAWIASADRWVNVPVTITIRRGDLIAWPLRAASTIAAIYTAVIAAKYYLARARTRSQVGAQTPPKIEPTPIATSKTIPDTFKLGAPIRRAALATLLAQYGSRISLDELRRSIQAAPGVNMTVAARAKLTREMDAAARAHVVKITNGGEYALTPEGRDWILDRLNPTGTSGDTGGATEPKGQSTPGPLALAPPGPTMQMAGIPGPTQSVGPSVMPAATGLTPAGGVAPTMATGVLDPKPVELTDLEAAVLRWCGHQWQPGVPVGIARGALETGMSALQVAQAADGLHSKGLVSKVGPNGVLLSPSGRDLCTKHGWHGGREAALRRDPRAPYLK